METYHIYRSHMGNNHYAITEQEKEDQEEHGLDTCEQCGDMDHHIGELTLPHEPTEEDINTLL